MSSSYRGKRVSDSHAPILNLYEQENKTPVLLNDGQRTIKIQQERVDKHGLYGPGNPTGAAAPWSGAPHIKYGKENHALDIQSGSSPGHRDHVAAFYRKLGVKGVVFNVPTESWHTDFLDEGSLKRAAAKARRRLSPQLRKGSKGVHVVRLKKLLAANGYTSFSTKPTGGPGNNRFDPFFGKYTRMTVIRFQKKNNLKADGIVGATTWEKLR